MMDITRLNKYQIVFQAEVLDPDDPAMLGRVRARPIYNQDQDAIRVGSDFNPLKDKWKAKDPFIFLPLLPFFFSQIPKKGELINVFFQNKVLDTTDKFYVQGLFSSPLNTQYEDVVGMQTRLLSGARYKPRPDLRNLDGSYKPGTEGLYPKPGDVSVVGRGNCDFILQETDLLLRAGKTTPNLNELNGFPFINPNRAFLQLSYFSVNKQTSGFKTESSLVLKKQYLEKIIIWQIDNIENNENVFNGSVGLYSMVPLSSQTTNTFIRTSIPKLSIGVNYSGPLEEYRFFKKTKTECIEIINKFCNCLYTGEVVGPEFPIKNKNNFVAGFPFAVSPSVTLYKKIQSLNNPKNQVEFIEKSNYQDFYNNIRLSVGPTTPTGFFIVSGKEKGIPIFGPKLAIEKQKYETFQYEEIPKTYAVMGGQKIYMISQDSTSKKGLIDLKDTIYGIPQPNFIGEDGIHNKTFSTVRGEELILLLKKIVAFLRGHVHNPISAPDTIADLNGQSIDEIQQILEESSKIILNENIRIN